jgi:SAM-dependent methyltransferase
MTKGPQWNAELYDDKHSFVWKMAAGLLEFLEAKSGELILDLGCGTGHLTSQIATTGAKVVGVDRSPEMIRQAWEKYPALRFEVMDARQISFPEQFDAVFSNATLHWINEPAQVIAGIAKTLRPGGRFVAEFGGKGNVGELLAAVKRAWEKVGLARPAPNPWYYPSISEYSGLLEQHGLAGWNAHFFAGPRIAANAGLAWFDAEHTELAEFDALTAAESALERFENSLNGLFRFRAADVGFADHRIHYVQLDHTALQNSVARC